MKEDGTEPETPHIGSAGPSVDRSAIRELLKLTPAQRARLAVEEARNLAAFDARIRKAK
jgi:hypothetical protein